MCYCDYGPAELATETIHKARKDYKCDECRRIITRGERYQYHSLLFDGSWNAYRWCLHCAAAQGIASDLADCHCWLYTEVWQDLREHACEERKNPALIRMVKGAERKWTYRRGPKKGQLVPIPVALVTA